MHLKNTIVDIDAVDSADTRFQISTAAATHGLRTSIRTVGLINAPILLPQAGRYRIVSGFRRIHACRALQKARVRACLVPPDSDALDCVRLAIADNALQRELNPVELARCLQLLQPFYPRTQQLAAAARDLGLALDAAYARKLLSITRLPAEVLHAVAGGWISVAVAEELRQLGHAEATVLAALFGELKIGLNKQRETLRLCREIARREGISMQAFIDSCEFQQIAADSRIDRSQKARQLRAFLLQRRMPALTRARNRFESLCTQLNLPPNVKLVPPPGFEGRTYRLACDFKSPADLAQLERALKKILANPIWSEILAAETPAQQQDL